MIGKTLGEPSMQNDFQEAMQKAGVIYKEQIIADGALHRFSPDSKGNSNGWYVFYGMAGAFGDWSQGIKEKWSTKNQGLSYQEQVDLQQQVEKAKKALDEERKPQT